MKLKNVNAKMTSFNIQNVIELLSIQLHFYVMLWCYSWKEWVLVDIFFVPTLVVECICVLIRWYATSLQNQRIIQRIRIRFNPFKIWMSHRKTNSNILFFFFTRNPCKTPCKNECENRMLWEQHADRIYSRRSQGNGIQWNANANIAAYKCEKLVFTFEPTLD